MRLFVTSVSAVGIVHDMSAVGIPRFGAVNEREEDSNRYITMEPNQNKQSWILLVAGILLSDQVEHHTNQGYLTE